MHGQGRQGESTGRGYQVGVLAVVFALIALMGLASVGLSSVEAETPMPGARRVAEVAVPSHSDFDASRSHGQRELAGGPAEPSHGPITLHLGVRRVLGETTAGYCGPVQISVGGKVVLQQEIINFDDLQFQVPASTTELTVRAPHHHVLVHKLKRSRSGGWLRDHARLVPITMLNVRVAALPADWTGKARIRLLSAMGFAGTAELRWQAGVWQATVPCLHGERIDWRLQLVAANECGEARGEIAPLQPGEMRSVQLDSQGYVRRRYRLVGPSAELMSKLRISCNCPGGVSPDASGRYAVWSRKAVRHAISTAYGEVALGMADGAHETVVRPSERIVGVAVRGRDGSVCDTWPDARHGVPGNSSRRAWVFQAERLPDPLLLSVRGEMGRYEGLLSGEQDFIWLLQEAPATTPVEVQLVGVEPDSRYQKGLMLRLIQGHQVTESQSPASLMRFDVVGGGDFQLEWNFMGKPSLAVRVVSVTPGQTANVQAPWPEVSVSLWTGKLLGLASLGIAEGRCRLRFGDGAHANGGRYASVSGRSGSFSVWIEDDVELWAPMMLWFVGDSRVPCEVVRRDDARREVVLRPVEQMRSVRLAVDMPGPWSVQLYTDQHARPSLGGSPGGWVYIMANHNQRPWRLHESERRGGVLLTGRDPDEWRAVSWFTLDARSPEVVVRPSGGREVEIVPSEPLQLVVLVGPLGQLAYIRRPLSSEPMKVFLPTGTRSLHVRLPDRSYREIPVGTATRIVIE